MSVEMEGIAGVVDVAEVCPGEAEYERNRHLMTAEASAAVRPTAYQVVRLVALLGWE